MNIEHEVQSAHDAMIAEINELEAERAARKQGSGVQKPETVCKICEDAKYMRGKIKVGYTKRGLPFMKESPHVNFNYCPFCGKRLGE